MKTLWILLTLLSSTAFAKTHTSIIKGTVANNWIQGGIAVSNRQLDPAIQCNGFFMVEDKSGISCFTRRGRFVLMEEGFLYHRELKKI